MSASNTELIVVDKRRTELVPVDPSAPTPMLLLKMAMEQNCDLAKLEKLMDLKQRWDETEARKAFIAAMSEFKANAITVNKDKTNNQYSSKYVSLGNLVSTVTPFLSQHNLSVRWDIDQSAGIKVTCIVTHVGGHSESVSMVCPPDKSGSKNPIQEIKSAITYAKACTFESICGLASTDANLDNDGNGVTEQWVEDYCSAIHDSSDRDECYRIFKEAYNLASERKNKTAQAAFIAAKDKRKAELQ